MVRRAFEDDLAPDTEQALRAGLPDSWRRAVRGLSAPAPLRWRTQLRLAVRPALFAAASFAMLVVGGIPRLGEPSNLLVAGVEGLKVSSLVSFELARTAQMDCHVTADDGTGRITRYSIRWHHSGTCRVEIESPGGSAVRTVAPDYERPPAASLLNAPTAHSLAASPADPALRAVAAFLSPFRIADLLDGRWQRVNLEGPGKPPENTWSVRSPAVPGRLLVRTNRNLPLKIELIAGDRAVDLGQPRPLLAAEFEWR